MNTLCTLTRRLAVACLLAAPVLALAQGTTLTVSAAASLTDAFKEIGQRFEAANPGTVLRFNFAASGVLVQQIIQGAPVDVFVSADQETMDRGIQQQVLDAATRRDFAANSLVLIAPLPDGAKLTAIGDLAGPAVKRIALGKPASVPVGRYSKRALESAGLWAAAEPKIVYADNVRQVLDYVARGEVDAGFVYRTDALLMPDKVRVVGVVEGHAPVRYPLALTRDSRNKALAQAFVGSLFTPESQAILARFGFAKP
jgi:molybdate transport system substrate-binding protein